MIIPTIILLVTTGFFAYCHLTRDEVEEQYYEEILKEVNSNG